MKKQILLITLFLFFSTTIFAQFQIEWQQCYGGSDYDRAYDIIPFGNGYMIIGVTESYDGDINYNHGYQDFWEVAIDSVGNFLWEKTYGGSSSEGSHIGFHANQSNDIYLLGASVSTDGDISNNPYPGSCNFWFVKIDSIGDIIWDRMVGTQGGQYFGSGSPTTDGGLVAIGSVCAGGG
ncbi:MAG: hypothetical protein U9R32_08595, partial [Bacteroidota bacterium]|nr:hypothetical protein [Bacteroidota bacterium]